MEPTTNYNLKKWDTSDRVLREDFNWNFDKIDEAITKEQSTRESTLKELAAQSSFFKLLDTTTTETLSSLHLDLTEIDWSTWQVIRIDLYLFNGQGGTGNVGLNGGGNHFSIMGSSTESYFLNAEILAVTNSYQPAPARMFLLPMGEPDNYVKGISFGKTGLCYSYLDAAYKDISYLSVTTSSSSFRPRCRLAVWGMR